MASIKEIARLANVSQGTASIVLSGKGNHYRISAATQQRIFEAAREMNYQPNISARRLRSGGETVLPIIALFWSLDTRTVLMSRFLKGFQQAITAIDGDYELLIQPYEGTKLNAVRSLVTGTRFNGAIIANATEADEAYLQEAQLNVPIVLYQRNSTKYSTVNVNNYESGEEVARLFASRGHRRVGTILPDISSKASDLRREGFLAKAAALGLEVAEKHIVYAEHSERGGYDAAKRLLFDGGAPPSALFIINDQMAVGALAAFHELGCQVPGQMEIVGHDDDEVSRFTIPALTTVHLPVEEMAGECLRILVQSMQHQTTEPISRRLDSHIVIRSSCGDFC
jgi:DNA-binding LacI/PurR family transcriptional regulator